MNARNAIQPEDTTAVLSLSFSSSRRRFIAGLSEGFRVFRTDNCLPTYWPPTVPFAGEEDAPTASGGVEGGIAIAEALDDRYIAFVAGGRSPAGKEEILVFWDCVTESEVQRFDFAEKILGIRVGERWMVVVLKERCVVFRYQALQQPTPPFKDSDEERSEVKQDVEAARGPVIVHTLHNTCSNPFALACLRNDTLVLPAQSLGQVQIITLSTTKSNKRVSRAHNSALRHMALSPSGNLLATASEQGTLIRVFSTNTLEKVAEVRRGTDKAVIWGLAFSNGDRWLACTSDKSTVHVFDLRPTPPSDTSVTKTQQHRKTASTPQNRLSSDLSRGEVRSVRSSSPSTLTATPSAQPTMQGNAHEYYGLRPPPTSASPSTHGAAVSAMSAFKSSGYAPRIMTDIRSVASMVFYSGEDPQYWQGGKSHSWTTAPNGTRKRVNHPIPSLPANSAGRPPKGLVAFAPPDMSKRKGVADDERSDDDGATFYVIGGGSDARWEMFQLLPADGGGWGLVKRGYRKFLTPQFVD